MLSIILNKWPQKATTDIMEIGASTVFQEKIVVPQIPPVCPPGLLLNI